MNRAIRWVLGGFLLSIAGVAFAALDIIGGLGGIDGLQRFLLFAFAGGLGMVSHYVKKWGRGEIAGSLVAYLFHDYPRNTVLAVATLLGAAVTAALAGQLEGLSVSNLIAAGLTTGFAVDSMMNKGDA